MKGIVITTNNETRVQEFSEPAEEIAKARDMDGAVAEITFFE